MYSNKVIKLIENEVRCQYSDDEDINFSQSLLKTLNNHCFVNRVTPSLHACYRTQCVKDSD